MPAYIVERLKIWSLDWRGEYLSKVPAVIESYGGKFLARGGIPQQIEGTEDASDPVVMLEFPDRESALAFWNSEKFAPLVALRQTGSSMEAMLVDGI